MIQKKFLGKFPIKGSSGHSTHRIIRVANEQGTNETEVSLCGMEGQIDVCASMAYEGMPEPKVLSQLILFRDLFNGLMTEIKEGKLDGLTVTRQVLPPRFYLSLEQEGCLRDLQTKPEDLREDYLKLVSDICTFYGVFGVQCEDDWLHERRIILPVAKGYTVELTKPTGHSQTFEIHADNNVDYSLLRTLSERFDAMAKGDLGNKIKIYDDRIINCSFRISFDTSTPQILTGESLEKRLMLEA